MTADVNYMFDLFGLLPGDILLSRGSTLQSKVISKSTGGNFSHAMLYVGGSVIHADGGGVYSRNPQRIFSKNKNDLAVYRLIEPISSSNAEKVCKAGRGEVGKLYDIKGAISSVLPGKRRSVSDRQFCSKLVADAFSTVQINFGKPPERITPNDFCTSDLLELKSDLVVPMSNEDVLFAESYDYNIELQAATFEWLSEARDVAKSRGKLIGSINNVFEYLIDHPEDNDKIYEAAEKTKYYSFANIDRERNPYRYDLIEFKSHLSSIDSTDQKDFMRGQLLDLNGEMLNRESNYYWAIRLIAEKDISFFRKNYELAKNLYHNTLSRALVINSLTKYRDFCRKMLEAD